MPGPPGAAIDAAVGELLVAAVTPMAIEVALAVQHEIQARLDEADRLRQLASPARPYEAELAHQRYLHVDPANRLVADVLEADWNGKLRALAEAQEPCQRGREADRVMLEAEQQHQIRQLATDFPRCGATRGLRCASASVWPRSCWRTSPCVKDERSRSTSAFAGERRPR